MVGVCRAAIQLRALAQSRVLRVRVHVLLSCVRVCMCVIQLLSRGVWRVSSSECE